MSILKITALSLLGYLMTIAQAYADSINDFNCGGSNLCDLQLQTGGTSVPEIDGPGAIMAVGLVIGLVALVREKFYRN